MNIKVAETLERNISITKRDYKDKSGRCLLLQESFIFENCSCLADKRYYYKIRFRPNKQEINRKRTFKNKFFNTKDNEVTILNQVASQGSFSAGFFLITYRHVIRYFIVQNLGEKNNG